MEYRSSQSRFRRMWILAGAVVVLMALVCAWRLQAQTPVAPAVRVASRAPALPMLAQVTDNEIVDMGGTFYHLEGRARRVTTRFADGAAVAERGADGSIKARSTDISGNEVGRLKVDQVGARDAEMLYETNGKPLFYAPVRPELRPTLDWATLQTHALRDDGHPASVQWQGRFARARGLKAGNLDDRANEVLTEFDQDIIAKTVRVLQKPGETKRPSTLTRIYDGGVEVGEIAWVPSQKLLMWNFKGLTKGSINEETLKKTPSGGWTFKPTMAWANVQALAFYTFHSRVAKAGPGSVARNESQPRNWLQKVSDAVIQPVSADTPGCDGLHWLDTTIYRPCCDAHDRCYAAVGCNSLSWWFPPAMSWGCTACNSAAVYCFYAVTAMSTGTCVYMPGACNW
jgi:hypothetical protein